MMIKYQSLGPALKKETKAIYVLIGQESYLLNDAAYQIKQAWQGQGEVDTKTLNIHQPAEWARLLEEATHYSLFYERMLLDIRWDKKSLDSEGKKNLERYLCVINSRCLVLIRAPNLTAKSLQWLSVHNEVTVIQIAPLSPSSLQHWITQQLNQYFIHIDPCLAETIHQFTKGNMLACAQAIDKIKLIYSPMDKLTPETVREHLTDQCEYQLYELSDACLNADAPKAIHFLRLAKGNRTEPTLLLWLMAQEIRSLIQLKHLLQNALSFPSACKQLKLWPSRIHLYQSALNRLPLPRLYSLLRYSQYLDERIKFGQNISVDHGLECLALSLCCHENVF